jgi:hypothetical protein
LAWARHLPDALIQRHSNLGTALAALGGVVGVLVLILYTKETYLLRKAAEQQTEDIVKPVLLIEFVSIDVGLTVPLQLKYPTIANEGVGPAFNVRIQPLIGRGVLLEFGDVRLLGVGKSSQLDFTIVQDGQISGFARDLTLLGDYFGREGAFADRMTMAIDCISITGKCYRTVHEIAITRTAKRVATAYLGIEELD